MKIYYVYILTNTYRTTFYIGVTNHLLRRVTEHHENKGSTYTKKYKIHTLVYYEEYTSITEAIQREKQLKNWRREWKINLIQSMNPTLKDLDIF